MWKTSIVRFRQDLRVYDNSALYHAANSGKQIIPVFIIDKSIIKSFGWLNYGKEDFLYRSIKKLWEQIKNIWWEKINVFYWDAENILKKLVKKYDIDCVFVNTRYDKAWQKADENISKSLESINCDFQSYSDFLLTEPWDIDKRKVFSAYYRLWKKSNFSTKEKSIKKIRQRKIDEIADLKTHVKEKSEHIFDIEFGERQLENIYKINYDVERNDLDARWTSMLSAYHRFWIFSIRQIYNEMKEISDSFVSELAWRDFWHHIYFHFPETEDLEFLEKRRNIERSNNIEKFEKWCKWETWYPIVDACMRQLNSTNRMHWRWRMIVASFLTKDLHIDRRRWEKYFRERLLDYIDSVNIGNWQRSASVGADPKPLRIFNPILQSKKFDKNTNFIKKRIPELERIEIKSLQDPIKNKIPNYPTPIVIHEIERKVSIEKYKKAKEEFENKMKI